MNDADLTLFCQLQKTASQSPDNLVFPAAQGLRIYFRLTEANAVSGHGMRVIDHFGRMQQCFGRDTSDIEADAAKDRVAFDQNNLQTEVRGTKCRRHA